MMPDLVREVTKLDLRVTDYIWQFAQQNSKAIEAHFAEQQKVLPQLFNGRILLARNASFEGDTLRADYFEVDFASFLYWRDQGFPDASVFNGFGMGALRTSDGAFILGEMAAHTANAGKIYFASGTADPSDVRDGQMDIASSIIREVEEETGLTQADYRIDDVFHCVQGSSTMAMIRILDVPQGSGEVLARLNETLMQQAQPEFARFHLVRRVDDITDAMPSFVCTFLRKQLTSA